MKNFFAKIFLEYLKLLTKYYVKRYKPTIIGVTGSVGKTTLTLAIYEILKTKYKVGMTYKEGKGLNSETGIPFAFLNVKLRGYSIVDWIFYMIQATYNFFFKKLYYEKMVVEMGVDKPGDMEHLLSMIQPQIGVFLSIAKVHGENFENLLKKNDKRELIDLIFEEKAKLVHSIGINGVSIINFDDMMIKSLKDKVKSKTLTFGLDNGADVRGTIICTDEKEFIGKVKLKDEEGVITYTNYMVNRNVFRTLLAAISVGIACEIDLSTCIKALEKLNFPPGRMSKIDGIKKTLILDSSYNASKPAMIEALDNLSCFKNSKKIAVLGDMRELGRETKSEHEEVAVKARTIADEIVAIGPAMRDYFIPKVIKLGFDKRRIHLFANTWKALDFIKNKLIKGGEVILVKGSQNTLFLEIIVEGLMKKKTEANKLLCRRGAFWDKKRQELKTKS